MMETEKMPCRVLFRGGAWLFGAQNGRCASRYSLYPTLPNSDIGFRVVVRQLQKVPRQQMARTAYRNCRSWTSGRQVERAARAALSVLHDGRDCKARLSTQGSS